MTPARRRTRCCAICAAEAVSSGDRMCASAALRRSRARSRRADVAMAAEGDVIESGGGAIEPTDDRDGCGLSLKLKGTGETRLAFATAAERDGWLKVLKAATLAKFVDSAANRALLPLLPTLPARAQSVFFGAGGSLARHTQQ